MGEVSVRLSGNHSRRRNLSHRLKPDATPTSSRRSSERTTPSYEIPRTSCAQAPPRSTRAPPAASAFDA
eukprot:12709706-Alexandrium_andersonii.AAC.1